MRHDTDYQVDSGKYKVWGAKLFWSILLFQNKLLKVYSFNVST